ncbi:MAG: hypothetical protein JWP80_1208 [Pseudomonas sp.]|nr:hypothetical protein [Pseudomonas sp.]
MSSKTLLLIPMLGLIAALAGCAGPMPKADPSEAFITLKGTQGSLLADDVDGQRISDGRYFEVTPGAHKLDMTLFVAGMGYANQEDCQVQVNFKDFKAGEHYQLVETGSGVDYRASLFDSQGHQLSQAKSFTCMSS